MKKKLRVNDEELAKALIYCKHKDGELCDVGSDGGVTYYLTEIGTQVRVDPETGASLGCAGAEIEITVLN